MTTVTLGKLKYDALDLIIVEALGKYGPRNIYKISKYLDIPESTIRHRIGMLQKKKLLALRTNVYHTNIGLKKGIVRVETNPAFANYINDFLMANDYWIFVKNIHGNKEGGYSVYTIPIEHTNKLIDFMEELKDLGVIWNYRLMWSTCFHRVNPTTSWYDLKNERWDFKWNQLIKDIELANTDLPITLKDPPCFPILADEIDLFILKELEKDATISLSDIAKMLNTSVQNVHYHYKAHIIKNFLIEDFSIYFMRFDPYKSVTPVFFIEFPNYKYLAKVANAFRDKPFAEVLGKILESNKLMVSAYLPIEEFFKMLETLNTMAELGFIRDYEYYLMSQVEKGKRQTINYEKFINGKWLYEHDLYIQRIHDRYERIARKINH